MNLKKIEKEFDEFWQEITSPTKSGYPEVGEYRYLTVANGVKHFLRQAIKQVVESVPITLPERGTYQDFPRKDNPVRCRLCGEKSYCSCIYGFEEHIKEVKKWKKKILKELEGGEMKKKKRKYVIRLSCLCGFSLDIPQWKLGDNDSLVKSAHRMLRCPKCFRTETEGFQKFSEDI